MMEIDWNKAQKIFQKDKENILDKLKNESDRYPYTGGVLAILAAGAIITASLIAPGLSKAITSNAWHGKGYRKRRLKQVLKRLYKQKAVEVVETKDGEVVRITQNGMTKALRYKIDEMRISQPKSWDKKWRIVIFDIPEGKKRLRDEFRKRLRQMGFFALQESVFVQAFPCFDQVEFLRQIYGVDIEVTYIIATKIEGQDNLKDVFKVG